MVRQTSSSSSSDSSAGDCDFGVAPDVDMCGWRNLNLSAFEWKASMGKNSYWVGGPRKDSNDANKIGQCSFLLGPS